MLDAGIKTIVVRTADTDVFVIFLSFHLQFRQYTNSDILIEFGKRDTKRFISINKASDDLGESFCLAVPFFMHSADVIQQHHSSKNQAHRCFKFG